jgi:hypothetical protein
MKNLLYTLILVIPMLLHAQIQRPLASPQAKVEQKIGLTDLKIEYYRPSKNNRVIFGEVVPFNETWRTGANENTKLTISDPLVFGKDTLKSGTYAVYTIPSSDRWEVIFYTDYSNWGTPEKWDEKKVALRLSAPVVSLNDVVESFTISLDKLTTKSADLNFTWDKTRATLHFSVPTATKMQVNVDKMMAGPSANDYYAAAEFYYNEKKEFGKALEWSTKAITLRPEAYWMMRLKAEIQAAMGDYNGAIETGVQSLDAADKANNTSFIDIMSKLMVEWNSKKK